MPQSWDVEKLDTYIQCPLKYKFKYIDKVPARLRLYTALETLLTPMLYETVARRDELDFNDPEPMMAELAVRAKLMQQDLALDYGGISRSLLAAARRLYVQWYRDHFRYWRYCGHGMDVTGAFGKGGHHISLEGRVPFVFSDSILTIRFSPMKRLMPSISDTLLSACAHSPNIRLLTFRTKKLGVYKKEALVSKANAEFAIDAAKRAVRGIKRNHFCPAHPFSHTCDSKYCTYFMHCKRYRFSAKST